MSVGIGQSVGKAAAAVAVDVVQATGSAAFTKAKLATVELTASKGVRRGIRTGTDALSLAVKAITFSFAAITTLAAGYLAGIGIDFLPFVDKYSIVSSILLYTSIAAALVSPLLVIPHTALAVRDHRSGELRARLSDLASQAEVIATRRAQNVASASDAKARLKDDSATAKGRTYLERFPFFGKPEPIPRPNDETARDIAETDRLQRDIDDDDAKKNALQDEQQQIQKELMRLNSSRWYSRLRAMCYAFYVIVGAALFLSVLPNVAAIYFTTAVIALYFFGKRTSFEVVAPMVSVHLLVFGLFLGLGAYNWPDNASLHVGEDDFPARVLMTTSTGYVAIGCFAGKCAEPGKSAERQLSFVPRESVTRISALRPPILVDWYRRFATPSFRLPGIQ